jgi:phosphoribosylformylglycinamidine (FGAM) synthase-like enzyme
VSGNVSLYNETPDGPILPTPVVGTIGTLEDRGFAVRMAWRAGDEIWLLGEPATDAAALAGSELAWRRRARGGIPMLNLDAAARLIRLVPELAGNAVIRAAHDCSVGGVAVALARMAIAAGCGLRGEVLAADGLATAAAFGERGGRVVVGAAPERAADLRRSADSAGVAIARLGVAGGDRLEMGVAGTRIEISIARLAEAWRTDL